MPSGLSYEVAKSSEEEHQFGHFQEIILQSDHEEIVYPARVWNCSKTAFPKRKLLSTAAIFVCLVTEPNMVVVCLPLRGAFCVFFIEDENWKEHFDSGGIQTWVVCFIFIQWEDDLEYDCYTNRFFGHGCNFQVWFRWVVRKSKKKSRGKIKKNGEK